MIKQIVQYSGNLVRTGKPFLILILLFFMACHKNSNKPEILTLENNGNIQWIGDGKPLPENDSLFYSDDPAPLFRKEFNAKDKVKSARLLITAAGYYKAIINGKRVGMNMLDPAWTDFSKRIYYT
ncbi:MAG: hypothetical protein EOM73_10375, partial [Bacteroidia bacterium]|nr:hypothetical protein [Bacteroidia bacterium]